MLGILLAACLIFALAITAYALDLFGIWQLFSTRNRPLPEEAEAHIQHHSETAAQEDWSASVTESLCDSSRILVTVAVSGGQKYILAPTDATEDSSVALIGLAGDRTLGEYAAEQGKQLLFVGASLLPNEHLGVFTQTEKWVSASDGQLHILVDAARSGGEIAGEAVCYITGVTAGGEILRLEVPFTLAQTPAEQTSAFVPDDLRAVPGISVETATVEKTPLGWTVRFISTVTDDTAFENIKRMDCDELTDFEGGGFVLEADGTWSTTWSMGQGNVEDTLTVRFYDWDEREIGVIVFRQK